MKKVQMKSIFLGVLASALMLAVLFITSFITHAFMAHWHINSPVRVFTIYWGIYWMAMFFFIFVIGYLVMMADILKKKHFAMEFPTTWDKLWQVASLAMCLVLVVLGHQFLAGIFA